MTIHHYKCIDCGANFSKVITGERISDTKCPYCSSSRIKSNDYWKRRKNEVKK